MTLHRRAFLTGIATALAAPAVVRAENLMKLWVPPNIDFNLSGTATGNRLKYELMERIGFGLAPIKIEGSVIEEALLRSMLFGESWIRTSLGDNK